MRLWWFFSGITVSDLFCVQFSQLLWTCRNIVRIVIIIIIIIITIVFIIIIPNNLCQVNRARRQSISLFVIIYFQSTRLFWICTSSIFTYVCMYVCGLFSYQVSHACVQYFMKYHHELEKKCFAHLPCWCCFVTYCCNVNNKQYIVFGETCPRKCFHLEQVKWGL